MAQARTKPFNGVTFPLSGKTVVPSAAWLTSSLQPWGVTVSLDPRVTVGPALKRWDPLPTVTPEEMTARGTVISESKAGEVFSAMHRWLCPVEATA